MKFDLEAHVVARATLMRAAAMTGTFQAKTDPMGRILDARYLARCHFIDDVTACQLKLSRDVGYHTSGWWKNPDYERCWHLSLSPAPSRLILPSAQRTDLNGRTRDAWLRAFFYEDIKLLWCEGAFSREGKLAGVTHWRLFCDENWAPLLPRGEVYGREFTEAGWRSASEVFAEEERAMREGAERAAEDDESQQGGGSAA